MRARARARDGRGAPHRLRSDEDLRHAGAERGGDGRERRGAQPRAEHHQHLGLRELLSQRGLDVGHDALLAIAAQVGLEEVERVRARGAARRSLRLELRPDLADGDAALAREARGARRGAVTGDSALHARRGLEAVDILRVAGEQLAPGLERFDEAVRGGGRVLGRQQALGDEAEGERVAHEVLGVKERERVGQGEALVHLLPRIAANERKGEQPGVARARARTVQEREGILCGERMRPGASSTP